MFNNKIKIIIVVLLALLPAACGYHFSGTGAVVPEGRKTIFIPVFLNGTSEPYVDVELTQAVIEEFMTDGRLEIVGPEEADLALHGKIRKYEVIPLSYNSQSYVQQYRIQLVIEASLEDLKAKKILWREQGIESSLISDYAVGYDLTDPNQPKADIKGTKVAKHSAIKKAGQDIAWTLRSRVLEGF